MADYRRPEGGEAFSARVRSRTETQQFKEVLAASAGNEVFVRRVCVTRRPGWGADPQAYSRLLVARVQSARKSMTYPTDRTRGPTSPTSPKGLIHLSSGGPQDALPYGTEHERV